MVNKFRRAFEDAIDPCENVYKLPFIFMRTKGDHWNYLVRIEGGINLHANGYDGPYQIGSETFVDFEVESEDKDSPFYTAAAIDLKLFILPAPSRRTVTVNVRHIIMLCELAET